MVKINNQKIVKQSKNKAQAKEKDTYDLKCHSIEELYEVAVKKYQGNDGSKSGEDRWNKMLAQTGTKKDKIAAVVNLVLENPQNSLKYFDMLIKWCFDNNHNFAIEACEALSNLYMDHVFGERSQLNNFVDSVQQHIKGHKKNTKVEISQLIGFYLQNQMKQFYLQLIKSMQVLLEDELTHIKKRSIKILGALSKYKEMRRTTLGLIINKLGDTDMEVVNQVSKCLKDEFYQDLLASETLLQETEKFLFRANLPQKSQFYVINFLNNINLKFLNEKSMGRLFEIFYHFFTKCIAHEDEDELASRLFLNSIKGLNKIFSFLKGGSKETKKNIEEKIQSVYKIVHTTPNFKAKVQLLLFLFQSHTYLHGGLHSRFYRLLYEFLSNDEILHSSLNEMFFDLVLITMKQDQNLTRVLAFCKRLLQLCFSAQSNFIITTLLMIDRVIQASEGFKIMLKQPQRAMEENQHAQNVQNVQKYDILKRDPLFCNANITCLWEIKAFCNHFHPTVRKFADCIISGKAIEYQGSNPLLEFNLTSFIQKFSLKKERKSQAWRIKVKRNLSKIRTSKYETLLNKSLDSFHEDEDFIKKYLQKRNTIHINKKKIQTTDIEEYADKVIEMEMDRLNPHDGSDQLSISPDNDDDFQADQEGGSWDEQGQEGQEGDDQQFGEDEGQEEEGDFDEDMGEQDYEDEDGEEDQFMSQEEDKQFEDAFEQIEQQDSYENKSKKINKRFGKQQQQVRNPNRNKPNPHQKFNPRKGKNSNNNRNNNGKRGRGRGRGRR